MFTIGGATRSSGKNRNVENFEVEVNNEEKQKKEEELHKKSLFLYVFILR